MNEIESPDEEIEFQWLPLTREDFETEVSQACADAGVEMNDNSRVAAVNYLHSLERNEAQYDPIALANYLRRAHSQEMTFNIANEIHKRRQEEAKVNEKPIELALSVVEPTTEH